MNAEVRLRAKYVTVLHASGRGSAERWRQQYEANGWVTTVTGSSKDTYEKLCALGPNPDIDAVAEAIGNKGWSYLRCDGCSDEVRTAVRIGDDTFDEPKKYCVVCIREAATVVGDLS